MNHAVVAFLGMQRNSKIRRWESFEAVDKEIDFDAGLEAEKVFLVIADFQENL